MSSRVALWVSANSSGAGTVTPQQRTSSHFRLMRRLKKPAASARMPKKLPTDWMKLTSRGLSTMSFI